MRRTPKIYVFGRLDKWNWHLRAGNGEIVCHGESHATKAKAIRAARRVQVLFGQVETSYGKAQIYFDFDHQETQR